MQNEKALVITSFGDRDYGTALFRDVFVGCENGFVHPDVIGRAWDVIEVVRCGNHTEDKFVMGYGECCV